jgi:hypothetical protein
VKTLRLLCVIVISRAKQLDQWGIVHQSVDLADVEMVANPEVNKNILIVMEAGKQFVHVCEHEQGTSGKTSFASEVLARC